MKWLQALKHYYSEPLEHAFKQFRLGAMLFFLGMVMIYIAHQLWTDSLQQELITLTGVIVVGLGFLIAMMAQIRMIISRMVIFFVKK